MREMDERQKRRPRSLHLQKVEDDKDRARDRSPGGHLTASSEGSGGKRSRRRRRATTPDPPYQVQRSIPLAN